MDYTFEFENGDSANNETFMHNDTFMQSEYQCDLHGSHSTRMVVSDVDDDDASLLHRSRNDLANFGHYSSQTLSDVMVDAGAQVTPLVQESEEIMARTTSTRGVNKIGNDAILPLSSFLVTDDSKTSVTIQPRGFSLCAQNSPNTLVDKYTVKYDWPNKESTERHDFNACSATSKPEDTADARKRIHTNLIDVNLATIPHKIAECTSAIPNGHYQDTSSSTSSLYLNEYPSQPQQLHNQRKNLSQLHKLHKIPPYETTSTTAKMPSKVAPCLPRQRSRAIAIKRSRPGDLIDTSGTGRNYPDKEPRQCDVELYDYATWRMYNRIIDHRRKNPLRIQHQEDHARDQQHSRGASKNTQSQRSNGAFATSAIGEHHARSAIRHTAIAHGQRYFVSHNRLYADDDYISGNEDEEIFDFEL